MNEFADRLTQTPRGNCKAPPAAPNSSTFGFLLIA